MKEKKFNFTYKIIDKRNIDYIMFYGGVRSCDCIPEDEIGINYFGSSEYLTEYEQKENISKFEYIVLKLFDTAEEAHIGEYEMLTENDAASSGNQWHNRSNGCKNGQFNTLGLKQSDATKNLMSIAKIGENNPMWGKEHTDATRKKMSISKSGENHPQYGKHHTEAHKKKQSIAMKGKVVAFDTVKKINIQVTTEEFAENDNLVGVTKGTTASDETKKKKSIAMKSKPKVTCPYCAKVGGYFIHEKMAF